MTVEEYNKKLKGIDAAYVKLRTELDDQFFEECDCKFSPGDVVKLNTISGPVELIVDEMKVLVDEDDVPDVYVVKSRFVYQPDKLFFYQFKCRDAEKI